MAVKQFRWTATTRVGGGSEAAAEEIDVYRRSGTAQRGLPRCVLVQRGFPMYVFLSMCQADPSAPFKRFSPFQSALEDLRKANPLRLGLPARQPVRPQGHQRGEHPDHSGGVCQAGRFRGFQAVCLRGELWERPERLQVDLGLRVLDGPRGDEGDGPWQEG